MELAYLSLLLKVAILQASGIIYETESWRDLGKDHNQFLKYYQRLDNHRSFLQKYLPLRYSLFRLIVLKCVASVK